MTGAEHPMSYEPPLSHACAFPPGRPRGFASHEGGATAVEFGIVVVPFLGTLFAIMQIALVLWSQQTLETAVGEAARQIYTGSFQTANAGQSTANMRSEFKKLVCKNVVGLFDCTSMLDVDVRVMQAFDSAAPAPPVTKGKYDPSGYGFQTPTRNDIVLIRASLEYPTFVRILNPTTSLANGNNLIMASATFRAEPF